MKKIDLFTNRYPISKTLRFSLIPVGKTEENFNNALFLEKDLKRADEYKKAKKLIDRYHKHFIERTLSHIILSDLNTYAELYFKTGKNDSDTKNMEILEAKMRKVIAKAFSSDKEFKFLFGKEIIQKILPEYLENETELNTISMFQNFTTYFTGFHENRKNIYTDAEQSTAIGYRCINDNLPKFLDNISSYKKISQNLSADDLSKLDGKCVEITGVYLEKLFCVDYFNMAMTQTGIDNYNSIIGDCNMLINLYNQQIAKTEKSKKLPLLKVLYKQILSDRSKISFLPEVFENDDEVITGIKAYFDSGIAEKLNELSDMCDKIEDYDSRGIFIKSGAFVTDISNSVFGDWGAVSKGWSAEYEANHPLKNPKNAEKYYDDQDKAYKKIASFSVDELQKYGSEFKINDCIGNIITYLKTKIKDSIDAVTENLENSRPLLDDEYSTNNNKKLCNNEDAIKIIKNLLDSVKDLERILKSLLGTGKEEGKDEHFYGDLLPIYDIISSIDALYDKTRNYITKKPYSNNKLRLNFENPQFLGGWDKNKETDYKTVILKKDNKYYLAIMDKGSNKAFLNTPEGTGENCYEKIEYKLLPGPNKMLPKVFFANSNLELFNPSKEILHIRETESFKKGHTFKLDDCHKFIDFFKESICKHPDWSQFGFEFSPTNMYKDISEFYNEVKKQGYSVKFKNIPDTYINELVNNGQLYLFQIYNKDFSEYSHGNPNLHTMYFKMLFDEENLKDVVYQLNGGAEMFYREASIKDEDKVVHPANQPIKNKNVDNEKKESLFAYDIIKDNRYTKSQFSLHLPITLNFKADGQTFINTDVRKTLKDSDDNYVIGIDRGERNLLYVCVINSKGEIVEQKSLNEIISGNKYKVNYHNLLETKEKGRDDARKNWGTIENIKELKEGYLSQVVNEICSLILKYDAIVAMEDLNSGFKNSRIKVEKQVYQKFENMLIIKLNYIVRKDIAPDKNGGLLNAYQLTNKVDGVNRGRQNGFIFYVPAWLTSKIDPVTGFVDLIKPKYTSVSDSLELIRKMDDIRYNEISDMFEFDIDFLRFSKASVSYKKKWTVCTNGDRIMTYRNPEKNNLWDNKTINLSDEFKKLFDDFSIDYQNDSIKDNILTKDNKDFFKRFVKLFSLTLQMRNSETGNVDVDYLISPVKNDDGVFYDSRNFAGCGSSLPENADANGAYNIARKALWAISVLKETDDELVKSADLSIKNSDWLEFVQK